jgi:hypothetical protein
MPLVFDFKTNPGGRRPKPTAILLTAHEERAIAVSACVDPRTVRRFVAGERVTSTCAARIELALRALGRDDLNPRGPKLSEDTNSVAKEVTR